MVIRLIRGVDNSGWGLRGSIDIALRNPIPMYRCLVPRMNDTDPSKGGVDINDCITIYIQCLLISISMYDRDDLSEKSRQLLKTITNLVMKHPSIDLLRNKIRASP